MDDDDDDDDDDEVRLILTCSLPIKCCAVMMKRFPVSRQNGKSKTSLLDRRYIIYSFNNKIYI